VHHDLEEIPLVHLTGPRQIAEAWGNIVRRVSSVSEEGKTSIAPASQELEKAVDDFILRERFERQSIGVWALVIPKEILEGESEETGHASERHLVGDAELPESSVMFADHRLPTLLAAGAVLRRVLSGGGGWGQKQGLLSLDPDVCYGPPPSPSPSPTERRTDESPDASLTQKEAIGEAARVGDSIQFFACPRYISADELIAASSASNVSTSPLNKNPGSNPRRTLRAMFGTVPSSIDDLPTTSREESSSTRKIKAGIRVIKHSFGALSEGGMSQTQYRWRSEHFTPPSPGFNNSKEDIHTTKVDVPFSRRTMAYQYHVREKSAIPGLVKRPARWQI
jgi:hypothetical protein